MTKKIILLTGTSGFIGFNFLKFALKNNYKVIDILKSKNKKNKKLNFLKKNYKQHYQTIFFNNYQQLKKIKKLKIDYFINFATLYKNNHHYDEISNFIDSNILFPNLLYDLIHLKTKKIINFGTMMQHLDGKNYSANNLYAATKNAFEMISNFYYQKEKKCKFYNLKFYESFGPKDNRKKLIPSMLENFKKNRVTKILSKKLELNIIHIDDIIEAINLLLKKNYKSGDYCLINSKNINIHKLISNINSKSKKKIKVKFLNKSVKKITKTKIKKLPFWKADTKIIKKIENEFYK